MRSGSTLVYLAARELLTLVQQSLFGAAANPVAFQHRHHAHQLLGVCDNAERCVLKTHNFAPSLVNLSDAVVLSHRDLRDALISGAIMFGACLTTQPLSRTPTLKRSSAARRARQAPLA